MLASQPVTVVLLSYYGSQKDVVMLLNVLNHAGRAFKESEKNMIRKLPIEKSQKTWSLTTEARNIS